MADSTGDDTVAAYRPVQFRGLTAHYLAAEDIHAVFRYPTEGYEADACDWVGLVEEGDSVNVEQCIQRVYVGDPSQHKLCDGGVWKVGKVSLTLPQEAGRTYRLLYVSRWGTVVGSSESLTVCGDSSEFPSITIQSLEDHVFIDKLRAQSPLLLSSNSANRGSSSFVLVTDEESRVHSLTHERSVDDQLTGTDTTSNVDKTQTESCNPEQVTHPQEAAGVDPVVIELQDSQLHQVAPSDEHVHDQPEVAGEVFLKGVELSDSTVLVQGISERDAWRLKQSNKELWIKIKKLSERMEGLQQENLSFKRELSDEKIEKQNLQDRVLELESITVQLEAVRAQLQERNRQIADERASLRATVGELQRELAAVSQHCRKLLDQLNESEERVREVSGERAVLKRRVEELEKHRRRRKQGGKVPEGSKRKSSELTESPKLSGENHRQEKQVVDLNEKGPLKHQKHGHRPREHVVNVHSKQPPSHPLPPPSHPLPPPSHPLPPPSHPLPMPPDKAPEGVARESGILSEGRVQEIASRLKGRSAKMYQCPVCQKQLDAHENEYSVLIHIEHCLTHQGD